jgi:hypothetical protein
MPTWSYVNTGRSFQEDTHPSRKDINLHCLDLLGVQGGGTPLLTLSKSGATGVPISLSDPLFGFGKAITKTTIKGQNEIVAEYDCEIV